MPGSIVEQYVMRDGIWRGIGVADIASADTPPPPPPGVVAVPPTYVGAGGFSSSSGAMRPVWPTGHLSGDIGLLVVESANDVMSLLDAQGFVSVMAQIGTGTASGAASTRLSLFWCRATSSAMPSPQVGFATTGNHLICKIMAFRGCPATGNPWDVLGTSDVAAAAVTAVSIPGFTTTTEQTLAVAIVCHATATVSAQASGETNASLTSLTERVDGSTGSGNGGGIAVITGIKATPGAVSATTATLATASVQARMSLALKGSTGSTAPPAESGTLRTMVGAFSVPKSLRGWTTPGVGNPIKPTPDTKFSDSNGRNLVGPAGSIQHARDKGYCFYIQVTHGSSKWADPTTGDFSPTIWNGFFDDWADLVETQSAWNNGTYAYTGGADEVSKAVKDGVLRAVFVIDDFIAAKSGGNANGFAHPVPYESIETICQHVKARYAWLPCVARGVTVALRDIAKLNGVQRQYRWLDAGWAQWRSNSDKPDAIDNTLADYRRRVKAYYEVQVAAGIECGLTVVGGANILNRGNGDDPTWGCVLGDNTGDCGMSPNEFKAAGLEAMANPNLLGFTVWAYDGLGPVGDTYYNQAAMLTAGYVIYDASLGRFDPPINRRGDLPSAL